MVQRACSLRRPRKRRVQINLTIDSDVLKKVRNFMKQNEETSLSSFTEGLYECVLREDCEGCPAYDDLEEEEKTEITGKAGVGKWTTSDTSEEGKGKGTKKPESKSR